MGALSGGLSGMAAQAIDVLTLMWMRTIMNYQYRYGGDLVPTVKKLYAEGGVPRFYRGLAPALFQAPVSRFGDTAANDGALAALEHTSLPTAAKTMCASAAAASFRVVLMPVDAWKTTKQVEGKEGLKKLIEKSKKQLGSVITHGSTPTISCAKHCPNLTSCMASMSAMQSLAFAQQPCQTRAPTPCVS